MIRRVQVCRRAAGRFDEPGVPPVVARVLAARGLRQRPDYRLGQLLPPVLSGLQPAARLLADAITAGRRILVVGDFDADGATGTALAVRGLRGLGAPEVIWRMPDRVRHGYGMSPLLARECIADSPAVVVTVDHGISSLEGIALLRGAGIEVIVTDHHLPGERLPEASAIVNPNCPGERFGSPNLAGVGVMFYTLIALRQELRTRGLDTGYRLDGLLDLVALGTVADLVPLDENNRRLVHLGLRRIRSGRCTPGVRALLEVAGRNLAHVGASDLGFAAGPRLNAAGRLDDISVGLRCLLADDFDQALALAQRLDDLNRERQSVQAEMSRDADRIVASMLDEADELPAGYLLSDPSWHPGVVGLVASRICEWRQRPVVALAPAGDGSDEWKGSCRSPAGVHMRDLLARIDARHPGVISRYGGHARAAGLSLVEGRIDAFREAFEQAVAALEFAPDRVYTDGELRPEELTLDSAIALAQAGPWGQGFEEPLFDGRFRVLQRRVVGSEHLKLLLSPWAGGPEIEAIAFRAGPLCRNELPEPLHVTYRLDVNRWRGQISLQLVIQHLVTGVQPAGD